LTDSPVSDDPFPNLNLIFLTYNVNSLNLLRKLYLYQSGVFLGNLDSKSPTGDVSGNSFVSVFLADGRQLGVSLPPLV
jgi:hypothetical protein